MLPAFHRIRRLPPYVFAEVNAMKADARARGADIIDFGMGNPDQPPPQHIIDKLVETLPNPKVHRYSTSRGIPGIRRAIAGYYARRFGVDIDPETETIATLGSKEGLANLAQAITTPGDVILAPNPSYPIHPYGFIIAGAVIRHIPVGPGFDFFEQLERAVRSRLTRLEMPFAGHHDLFVTGGKQLWDDIHEFLHTLSEPEYGEGHGAPPVRNPD